jgi:hypothetical protein
MMPPNPLATVILVVGLALGPAAGARATAGGGTGFREKGKPIGGNVGSN